jgi:hypothetical protein
MQAKNKFRNSSYVRLIHLTEINYFLLIQHYNAKSTVKFKNRMSVDDYERCARNAVAYFKALFRIGLE